MSHRKNPIPTPVSPLPSPGRRGAGGEGLTPESQLSPLTQPSLQWRGLFLSASVSGSLFHQGRGVAGGVGGMDKTALPL